MACPATRAISALALLLAASLCATAQVKEHQATGSVASANPVQVILIKKFGANEAKWTFVVNAKTKLETKPAKGMRLRIYYHEDRNVRIADRIRPAAPARTAAPATATGSTPPAASPPKVPQGGIPEN